MRKWVVGGIFLSCIVLLVSIASLLSAQAAWSLWVYNPATGQVLRVDSAGDTIDAHQIPAFSDGIHPQTLHVAEIGSLFAYTTPRQDAIHIFDTRTGSLHSVIQRSDIGIAHNEDDWLQLGSVVFDDAGEHLIYAEHVGGMGWQVHVYQLATQRIIQTLHYQDAVTSAHSALHGGVMPQIHAIQGDRVTLTVDTELPVDRRSYHWFYESDLLIENVAIAGPISEALATTGEIMTAQHDYRFAMDVDSADMDLMPVMSLHRNSLHVYTSARGRVPVVASPNLHFEQLWYVQGGDRLLAQAAVGDGVAVRVLYARDGSEIRRYPAVGTSLAGTPDGFIYTTEVNTQTAIVTVETMTDGSGATLWLQPGEWHILWAGYNLPASPLAPWVGLAQPEQDPIGTVSDLDNPPTLTPPPAYPVFRSIGQAIQVYVPEDGYLNLREEASLSSNVVTLLPSGARGTIIGGPAVGDGYTWWQVTINNQTGWLVESLEDSLALIPPQLIPSMTPMPSPTTTP